jgi:hypothetical protein
MRLQKSVQVANVLAARRVGCSDSYGAGIVYSARGNALGCPSVPAQKRTKRPAIGCPNYRKEGTSRREYLVAAVSVAAEFAAVKWGIAWLAWLADCFFARSRRLHETLQQKLDLNWNLRCFGDSSLIADTANYDRCQK